MDKKPLADTVTAVKENTNIKIYVPARLVRAQNIQPGDLLNITVENTGYKSDRRSGDRFKAKERAEELKKEWVAEQQGPNPYDRMIENEKKINEEFFNETLL